LFGECSECSDTACTKCAAGFKLEGVVCQAPCRTNEVLGADGKCKCPGAYQNGQCVTQCSSGYYKKALQGTDEIFVLAQHIEDGKDAKSVLFTDLVKAKAAFDKAKAEAKYATILVNAQNQIINQYGFVSGTRKTTLLKATEKMLLASDAQEPGQCFECRSPCLTCSSATQCLTCAPGYSFNAAT